MVVRTRRFMRGRSVRCVRAMCCVLRLPETTRRVVSGARGPHREKCGKTPCTGLGSFHEPWHNRVGLHRTDRCGGMHAQVLGQTRQHAPDQLSLGHTSTHADGVPPQCPKHAPAEIRCLRGD
jgi:hypothetical protein